MKPFNLEEYLANPTKKVVTRDGKDARIICIDRRDSYFPIVALVAKEPKAEETARYYTKDGKFYTSFPCGFDLFFATEKHEGWLNIYRGESGFYLRGNPYKSKEEADEVAKANYKTFCTTVKIEWEE